MTKVSIILPSYNQPDLLKRALDSCLMQTYTNFEIIITDDSTNNDVENLIKTYTDKRIRYYHNEKPLGSPKNWNFGLSLTNGEYIKWLHHDDWFEFDYSLEEFVKALDENPEADIAFSSTQRVLENGKKIGIYNPNSKKFNKLSKNELSNILYYNYIGAPSVVIYRKTDLLFDENLQWFVDIDFYFQILKQNNNYVLIEKPLVNITESSPTQITNYCECPEIELSEALYIANKYSEILKQNHFLRQKLKGFLRKYNINSIKEIRKYGSIPEFMINELKRYLICKRIKKVFFLK